MPDLTTLTDVKNWQGGLAPSNVAADALLAGLITSTSADFLRAIRRPDLLTATYTELRTGDGSSRLVLRHWPVTGVASLTVGGVVIPARGAGDGWYLDPDVDPERRFVLYLSGALSYTDGAAVAVTYSGGYATTPTDIAQAVTEWVVFRYVRKSSSGQKQAQSFGKDGERVTFEEIDMPLNTQRVIEGYLRAPVTSGRQAAAGTDLASGQGERKQTATR